MQIQMKILLQMMETMILLPFFTLVTIEEANAIQKIQIPTVFSAREQVSKKVLRRD